MSDTVDQQGTPSEAEIAWLAGIIEGEGTLTLDARARTEDPKRVKEFKVSAAVVLYNTDAGIVSKFCELMDRLHISYYIDERVQKPMMHAGGYYKSSLPMLKVLVKGMESTYRLLGFLYPWMFGDKKHRCALMIKYLTGRLQKIDANGGCKQVPYDAVDLRIVADSYAISKRAKMPVALVGLLNELEQNAAR